MTDLTCLYAELRAILAPYASRLDTLRDDANELHLDTRHIQKNKKPLFFAAVQLRTSTVNYHLMPVYVNPALLAGLSPELKSRMHGKSCFHFARADPALFKELAALTQAAYESYEAQGFV